MVCEFGMRQTPSNSSQWGHAWKDLHLFCKATLCVYVLRRKHVSYLSKFVSISLAFSQVW